MGNHGHVPAGRTGGLISPGRIRINGWNGPASWGTGKNLESLAFALQGPLNRPVVTASDGLVSTDKQSNLLSPLRKIDYIRENQIL